MDSSIIILLYKKAIQQWIHTILSITPGGDTLNCIMCICYDMRYLEVPQNATDIEMKSRQTIKK